jgi:hypothetical protein
MTIEEKLNCVYTDFRMLQEGAWDGDPDSCEDSITMLERLVENLKDIGAVPDSFELGDTRDGE